MRWLAGVYAGVMLLLSGLATVEEQAQELSGKEGWELLRQEALPRWREYERHAEQWVGSTIYQEEIRRGDGQQIRSRSRYVIRQSTVGGVYEHYLEDYDPWEKVGREDFVYGVNSQYAFWLEKRSARSGDDKGWRLRAIHERSDGRNFFPGERNYSVWKMVQRAKLPGVRVLGKTLPELLEYEPFRVVGMREVKNRDQKVWVVDFECPHVVDKPPYYAVQGGTVTLDPAAFWTIVEGRLRTQDIIATGVDEIRVEYKADGRVPIPVRYYRSVSRSNGTKVREEYTYDWTTPAKPLPESEFTLSYYGLPEPPGVTWEREKKTPVYVWLLVTAGVLGVLALLFRWLAHRRRRGSMA